MGNVSHYLIALGKHSRRVVTLTFEVFINFSYHISVVVEGKICFILPNLNLMASSLVIGLSMSS